MGRIEPGQGQESVWDYPRPPRVEPVAARIVVRFAGETLCDTTAAFRVLETSHPPVYYLPPADLRMDLIHPAAGQSLCEFKGEAEYVDLIAGDRRSARAGWVYRNPRPGFEAIRDHIAFYAGKVDEATVGGETVMPQAGDFYGGWITAGIVGPFKGGPGTRGW